ncbi:PhnJ protein [Pseudomonas syringae pv. tomato]|nr:PhnJ protein [Pseudomonas syringae pv. tomato]
MRDGQPVRRLGQRTGAVHPGLRPGLWQCGAQSDGHGAGGPLVTCRGIQRRNPFARAAGRVCAGALRQRRSGGLCLASQVTALRGFSVRAGTDPQAAQVRTDPGERPMNTPVKSAAQTRPARDEAYNFAYLDEQTKRMIRRALLKAVAIPGYQVPFGGREMPLPYGWGTGGMQLTAAILGDDDVLKVIDQGADDTTNAVSIRRFFARTAGIATTERTPDATVIQTRHRIPETPLHADQIMVYQVPIPEPLRFIEPSETETRTMHALDDYGVMHVKLYEDIATFGHIATSYAYPVMVDERYVMDPSPIPKFDNPKLHMSPALMLFGAGREKRLYAVPPFTQVVSLDFEDHPFEVQRWEQCCAICGSHDSFLDELILDDAGTQSFVCSDTDYCAQRVKQQENAR